MPRNRYFWWQKPTPQVRRFERRKTLLLKFAKFDTRGMRVQAGDELVAELVERGLIRLKLDAHVGFRGRTMSHTYGFITEAGWTAVWNEDLGVPKPIPKSQRREKRGRYV